MQRTRIDTIHYMFTVCFFPSSCWPTTNHHSLTMCKPDSSSTTTVPPTQPVRPLRLLLSAKSYQGQNSGQGPDAASAILTGLIFVLFLVTTEQLCLQWLTEHQDMHELLAEELHRRILARHVGVDTLACCICAALGFANMHTYADVWKYYVKGDKNAFVKANYLNRVLAYDPASLRLCLFFTAYQIKNLYDTIIFDDGPVFIFHHVFSAITAYGCMVPKISNYYPFFFVGLSEISTAVLCLLANFDPVHGIPGLGEAFPTVKIVLAALFVVTFLICRVITWPILSYHFQQDIFNTLKHHKDDPRVQERQGWYYFHVVSNASLTLLQWAWLLEIFYTVYKEAVAMGLIQAY